MRSLQLLRNETERLKKLANQKARKVEVTFAWPADDDEHTQLLATDNPRVLLILPEDTTLA